MRNSIIAIILAACAGLTLLAADTAPPAAAVTVHIKDFAFVPKSVTVKSGDTVRWINDDDVAHTVTAADKSFDSGDFDKGKSWTQTFAKAGSYEYFCADHTSMKGTVKVADGS